MKKLVFTASLAACLATAEHDSLRIFTWEDYLDPDLITQFEQETGISIEFIYYDNDEIRDQVMAETAGFGYDVILVDEVELQAYINQKWVTPLSYSELTFLDQHGEEWSEIVPSALGYAVPYGWGTYGLTYRKDLVDTPPEQWVDLFNPNTDYAGSIQMPPQASELQVLALMAAGYQPNDTAIDALKSAESLLLAQRPLVKTYKTPDLSPEKNLLIRGEVKVAVTYSSDALYLLDESDDLAYISPKDGTVLWIDFWTISDKSHNKEKAHTFLNFLLKPEIVAQNIQYHYTATFSQKAMELIPAEILENPSVYPSNMRNIKTLTKPNRNSIRSMMRIINSLDIK